MFGYLRFILALLVALSHIGVRFYGLNPGVIAVVVFYILAGYVVSHIYLDVFANQKKRLFTFYKDRFLRIFPLYIFVTVITAIFLLATSFANPIFTYQNIFNNITILPLNYYMYIDSTVLTNPSWCLIPPAWSLAAELQAYILLPFALMFSRLKITLALISFLVYIAANFSLLNSDYFGYRFVIGVFFIFLLGSAIQSYKKSDKAYLLSIWLSILILIPLFIYTNSFDAAYTKETCIGLLLGIPTVLAISKAKMALPYNKIIGEFSYALFLTHFLAIWILDYIHIQQEITLLYITEAILLSLAISSLCIMLINKCAIKVRNINN